MIVSTIPPATHLVGLSRHEIRVLSGHAGQRIASQRGSVWITQDGDPRDIVIEAGESHALDRDGPVYVQALEAAWVRLPMPAEPARAEPGLWGRLARAAFT